MKYEIRIELTPFEIELPDGLTEDEIDKALDEAVQGAYLEDLVANWDAWEV